MSQENMRASDADREQIVTKLRSAMDDGRINLHEFDERVQQVYAAKTYGELTPVLSDLPAQRNSRSGPAIPKQTGAFPTWVKIMWTPWVFVSILVTLIWLATGMGYFWPFWVIVPWGLAYFIPTTIGYLVNKDQKNG
ncbi:DUF1707 domain-containing protein [Nocardia sp. NPDC056000]|uniref:DUF1707 domain-containing protein n=1 Tax=Nocardia sp. NPDC056000 TaxID=3345674 RepID=UPI0035E167AC